MSHPLFGPEVRLALDKDDAEAMSTFCDAVHPATAAETLEGEFSSDEIWNFLQRAPVSTRAEIFSYFPPDLQVELAEHAGRAPVARLIEAMSPDDRNDLLRRLDPVVSDQLIRLVDEADRREIAALASHGENTAGALMTPDYAWLPAGLRVEEALDRLRLQAPDRETIYYIYIVDDQRRILGVATLRDLILAARQALLDDIMETRVETVNVDDDREIVSQTLARYDLIAVPVVDDAGRLVGIVTHDDAMDALVSAATEDAHRMGGVDPVDENYLEASFAMIWRKRAVWLSCLFIAELFTFTALAAFEDAIAEVVVLSLFVPLCISTGGNSGSQAATLITRAMALGQTRPSEWARVLRHELLMGLALGLTLGAMGFCRAFVTSESVRSASAPRPEKFRVVLPAGSSRLEFQADGTVVLPADALQEVHGHSHVKLPADASIPQAESRNNGELTYDFPGRCTFPREPVSLVGLAVVISISVSVICIWGTLVGSMLPLLFRVINIDPGVASSPFVATFVDVTGIIIFFSVAKFVLALA
ncbi:MAG: magnesium transporter [Planctomycetes bacterium]|nr:magnesium transporter [Planctomycetota bacterium]